MHACLCLALFRPIFPYFSLNAITDNTVCVMIQTELNYYFIFVCFYLIHCPANYYVKINWYLYLIHPLFRPSKQCLNSCGCYLPLFSVCSVKEKKRKFKFKVMCVIKCELEFFNIFNLFLSLYYKKEKYLNVYSNKFSLLFNRKYFFFQDVKW